MAEFTAISELVTTCGESWDGRGLVELDPMCIMIAARLASHTAKNGSQ